MRLTPFPSLTVVALCLLATGVVGAAPARAASYVVLPADGPGLLPSVRDGIEVAVRDTLVATGARVQPRDETAALLADAAAGGLSCSLDSALCAARIGAIAGVDHVVITSVKELGRVIGVTLVETAGQRALRTAYGALVATARDGGASVREVVARLLQPPALLDVEVEPPDARVTLDNLTVAPLDAPLAVRAEPLSLTARAAGHAEATRTVTPTAGAVTRVALALVREGAAAEGDPPPVSGLSAGPDALVVAGIATAGAGSIVAAVGGIGAVVVEADLSTAQPGADERYRDPDQLALGRALLVTSGVGLVIAAVGAALLATAAGDAPGDAP